MFTSFVRMKELVTSVELLLPQIEVIIVDKQQQTDIAMEDDHG